LKVVSFLPRARLLAKAQDMLSLILASDLCTPATASKFRGTAGCAAHALWGRVGRAGFGPFRQRQYSDVEPFSLSHSLTRSIHFFQIIFGAQPPRELKMDTAFAPTFVIASDARYDLGIGAGAGYLLIEPGGQGRRGACGPIEQSILTGWGYGDEALSNGGNPIAICEAAAVAAAMVAEARHLQGAQDGTSTTRPRRARLSRARPRTRRSTEQRTSCTSWRTSTTSPSGSNTSTRSPTGAIVSAASTSATRSQRPKASSSSSSTSTSPGGQPNCQSFGLRWGSETCKGSAVDMW
jgi:hypothetical protein